jgi:hypothetical protein
MSAQPNFVSTARAARPPRCATRVCMAASSGASCSGRAYDSLVRSYLVFEPLGYDTAPSVAMMLVDFAFSSARLKYVLYTLKTLIFFEKTPTVQFSSVTNAGRSSLTAAVHFQDTTRILFELYRVSRHIPCRLY